MRAEDKFCRRTHFYQVFLPSQVRNQHTTLEPPQKLGDLAKISMNVTSTPAARSPGVLETPVLRQSPETERSQTPYHVNAKEEHSNLVWVRPGLDASVKHPFYSVMSQLSGAFAATTLDEPRLLVEKPKRLPQKQLRRRGQLAKKPRQSAASAAMSPEERAKKSAKRRAKRLRKKEKHSKKSIKRPRQRGDALVKKGETCPGHSQSSYRSQIIQDDHDVLELEPWEDFEEEQADTTSTDGRYSPDERLGRAMKALQERKSTRRQRKVRNIPAKEQKQSENNFEPGFNRDTIMD